jgi:sodium transport system permease protein
VLFRSGAGKGFDPRSLRAARGGLPTEGQALLLFFTVLALMFYLSTRPPDTLAGVVRIFAVSQVAAILLPTLLFARRGKLRARETFSLRPLPWSRVPLIAMAAIFTLVLVLAAQIHLMPSRGEPQGFEKVAAMLTSAPIWLALLLFAVLPPLCEELLCRGFLLSAFRARYGEMRAVVITACLFGALHLDLYRFPATAAAGLLLGYLCVRTGSLWAGVMSHSLHNGLIALTAYWPALAGAVEGLARPGAGLFAALLAALGLAGTLYLIERGRVKPAV